VCNAASVRKTNDTRKTLVLHPQDRCGKIIFKKLTLESMTSRNAYQIVERLTEMIVLQLM
jgi:hypothetical protein